MGDCTLVVWTPEYIETVFADGKICPALLSDDTTLRERAAALGYVTDVRRMHIEHELAHTMLAQRDGLTGSPVLYHVAGGTPVEDDRRAEEEARVMEFQRTMTHIRRATEFVLELMK